MDGLIAFFLIAAGVVCGYFLPSIVAAARRHQNANPICVINLFFGWTVLGWVVCLAWSLSSNVYPAPDPNEPREFMGMKMPPR